MAGGCQLALGNAVQAACSVRLPSTSTPTAAHNIYKIPIHIYCFGTADNRQRVVDRLRRAGKVRRG